jgi:predicted TIM-barrel fold metal-dependent hydrolase
MFIRKVGVNRLMMASDFPINLGMQRMLWDSLAITDEERASGLGGLALKVFGLEGKVAAQTWPA